MGKKWGAQAIINGRFQKIGEIYQLTIKSVDVETSTIKVQKSLFVSDSDILATLMHTTYVTTTNTVSTQSMNTTTTVNTPSNQNTTAVSTPTGFTWTEVKPRPNNMIDMLRTEKKAIITGIQ